MAGKPVPAPAELKNPLFPRCFNIFRAPVLEARSVGARQAGNGNANQFSLMEGSALGRSSCPDSFLGSRPAGASAIAMATAKAMSLPAGQ